MKPPQREPTTRGRSDIEFVFRSCVCRVVSGNCVQSATQQFRRVRRLKRFQRTKLVRMTSRVTRGAFCGYLLIPHVGFVFFRNRREGKSPRCALLCGQTMPLNSLRSTDLGVRVSDMIGCSEVDLFGSHKAGHLLLETAHGGTNRLQEFQERTSERYLAGGQTVVGEHLKNFKIISGSL